jgi:hypothetical protein
MRRHEKVFMFMVFNVTFIFFEYFFTMFYKTPYSYSFYFKQCLSNSIFLVVILGFMELLKEKK